ncbi:MAG TPA: hypothetical protein VIY28_13060 [Pseudonocardiaceae bacterium]
MSGRVLTSSAIVDIATDRSVYGRAFLVAAVELGMTFPTPSTSLLQAWAAVPPQARALLDLFLDAPAVVVEDLGPSVAGRAGVRAHAAHQAGRFDVAAAHAVDVAITRGFPILTAEPGPLRAIDPDVEIEELPAP